MTTPANPPAPGNDPAPAPPADPPTPPTPAPTPPPAQGGEGKTAEALQGILTEIKGIPDAISNLMQAQGQPQEPAPPATPGQEPPAPATPEPPKSAEPKTERRYAGAGGAVHRWFYGSPSD